jgi:hypothetical protein
MFKRAVLGVVVCATATIGLGAAAFAGESTGSGKGTPLNAHVGQEDRVGRYAVEPSACAFSGLDDNDGGEVTPGVTQTPAGVPGFVVSGACRGPATGAIND